MADYYTLLQNAADTAATILLQIASSFLRQSAIILLKNVTVITKSNIYFITNVTKVDYKIHTVFLQSVTVLLKNASNYKMPRYIA